MTRLSRRSFRFELHRARVAMARLWRRSRRVLGRYGPSRAARRAGGRAGGRAGARWPAGPVLAPLEPRLLLSAVFGEGAAPAPLPFGDLAGFDTVRGPRAVAVGDLDGDGIEDAVTVGEEADALGLHFGDGAGGLREQRELPVAVAPRAVRLADMNGDGALDLVAASASSRAGRPGTVTVLLNDGAGRFETLRPAAGGGPVGPVLADLDGDGLLDLVTTNLEADDLSVFFGLGAGRFEPERVLETGRLHPAARAEVRDFDADGHLDLAVVAGLDGELAVFFGDGGRGFEPVFVELPGAEAQGAAVGELNGGGDDVVVAMRGSDEVLVVSDLAPGSAPTLESYVLDPGAGPKAPVLGDVDGDGFLDIVVNEGGDGVSNGRVTVLFGDGTGAVEVVSETVGIAPGRPVVAELGGAAGGSEGLDIAVPNTGETSVSVLENLGIRSFEVSAFEVGAVPETLAAGELGGPGGAALVTANPGAGSLSVLLPVGSGSLGFQAPLTLAVGGEPVRPVIGDVDGDGADDILVADRIHHDVAFFAGAGGGTLEPATFTGAARGPGELALVDLTGDGRPEVIAPGREGASVAILFGEAAGLREAGAFAAGASQPVQLVAGDFTGNGHLDVAVAAETPGGGVVNVLPGAGDGTLGAPQTFATGAGPRDLGVGDFTGDGVLDLATLDAVDGTVSVLAGAGDGTFAPPAAHAVGVSETLLVGDLEGDGDADILVAGAPLEGVGLGRVEVLRQESGTLGPAAGYRVDGAPVDLVARDVDADGLTDVVALSAPAGETGAIGASISVLRADGGGAFFPFTAFPVPVESPRGLAVISGGGPGDGTGPGLAVLGGHAERAVLARVPGEDGFFGEHLASGVAPGVASVAVGELDGNGFLDVVSVSAPGGSPGMLNVTRFGPGGVEAVQAIEIGLNPVAVRLADMNGDGHLDAVVSESGDASGAGQQVSVRSGDGAGGFGPPIISVTAGAPGALAVGELTGDAHPDVAVTLPETGEVQVLAGDGSGALASGPILAAGAVPGEVALGDLDGDGRLDLVVSDEDPLNPGVRLFLADGGGGFTDAGLEATFPGAGRLALSDLSGDGLLDIVVGGGQEIGVLAGDGSGGFSAIERYGAGVWVEGLAAGDVDGDGRPDVVATGTGPTSAGRVSVLLADEAEGGGGGLLPPRLAPARALPGAVALGDVDGDGRLDVVSGDAMAATVSVIAGRGAGRLGAAPATPLAGANGPVGADGVLAVGELTGDGRADALVVGTGGQGGQVLAILGGGRGPGFESVQMLPSAVFEPVAALMGDVDGDGLPDVVLADGLAGSEQLEVRLGADAWTTGTLVPLGAGVSSAVMGDLDGDGLDDVVSSHEGGGVEVRFSDGSGTFSAPVTLDAPAGTRSLALADLDGDGFPDIVAGSEDEGEGKVKPILNRHAATARTFDDTVLPFPVSEGARALGAGDFDGDGLADVVALGGGEAHAALTVLLGDGAGTFTAGLEQDGGPLAADVTLEVGEANGDGRLDLLVSSADVDAGEVVVFAGDGAGGFAPGERHRMLAGQVGARFGDVDGDGDSDIIAAGGAAPAGQVAVLASDGVEAGGTRLAGTVFRDFDGNGLREAGEPGLAGVSVFLDLDGDGLRGPEEPHVTTAGDDSATPEDEAGAWSLDVAEAGVTRVRVERPAGDVQTAPLTGKVRPTLVNPEPGGLFGIALGSLAGGERVAADPEAGDGAGAVHLFDPTGGALLRTLTHPAPGAHAEGAPLELGTSVLGFGHGTLLAGAEGADHPGAGEGAIPDAGAVFHLDAADGSLLASFENPAPEPGAGFGIALARVGADGFAVGADLDDSDAGEADVGVVHLFERDGTLRHTLAHPQPAAQAQFGFALDANGTEVLVGAPGGEFGDPENQGGEEVAGRAFIFDAAGGSLVGSFASPGPAGNRFGHAVALLPGGLVAVGAPGDDAAGPDAGAVHLFGPGGSLLETLRAPAPEPGAGFGARLAAGPHGRLAVSAPGAGAEAPAQDGAGVAGTVYLFETPGAGSGEALSAPLVFTAAAPAAGDAFGAGIHLAAGGELLAAAPFAGSGGEVHRAKPTLREPAPRLVSAGAGGEVSGLDFGLAEPVSIGDRVWIDQDGDGVQDAGEPGAAGVEVRLFRPGPDGAVDTADDVFVEADTTDASGFWFAGGLPPGDYFVKVMRPAGAAFTAPDAGAEGIDSDIDPASWKSGLRTLTSGAADFDVDAGLLPPVAGDDTAVTDEATLLEVPAPGLLANDTNADGTSTPALSVVAVEGSAAAVASAIELAGGTLTVSAGGGFTFDPGGAFDTLAEGESTQVSFTYTVRDALGGEDEATATIEVNGLADPPAGDPPVVGDLAWFDLNGDGLRDAGEPGVAGVGVELVDAGADGARGGGDDTVAGSAVTDAQGHWTITAPGPGDFFVRFVPPVESGLTFTAAGAGAGADGALDSDADPATGQTPVVSLTAGQVRADLDAGFLGGAIEGRVFGDADGDGLQEAGEGGVSGVEVELVDAGPDGLAGTSDDAPVASELTGSDGTYRFDGLVPGNYVLRYFLPEGFAFSPADVGSDETLDSDADPALGESPVLAVGSGELVEHVDAGVLDETPPSTAGIAGRVFEDVNGDGVQGLEEPGLGGVTVELVSAASGDVAAAAVTGTLGDYALEAAPGTYVLRFSAPAPLVATSPGAGGDPARDSDIDPATGETEAFTADAGGSVSRDAGYFRPVSVGDRVWRDLDGDGVQDPGEPGVEGVQVLLRGVENLPESGGAAHEGLTAETDSSGQFLFEGLAPGSYRLHFLPGRAFPGFTAPGAGGPGEDSDADPATGRTAVFAAPSGAGRLDLDAGLLAPDLAVKFGRVGFAPVITPGESGSLEISIANPGGLFRGEVSVDLYIDEAARSAPGSGAALLGRIENVALDLASFEGQQATAEVSLPESLAPGEYRFFAVIAPEPADAGAGNNTIFTPHTGVVEEVFTYGSEPAGEPEALTASAPPGAAGGLDVDGDGRVRPLTDGILLTRYLAGFEGAALSRGAVGAGAVRSEPAEIRAYLDARVGSLDLDGDGRLAAGTDGLLMTRGLFGFEGAALTRGALGAGAVRTDPALLASFLAGGVGGVSGGEAPAPPAPVLAAGGEGEETFPWRLSLPELGEVEILVAR